MKVRTIKFNTCKNEILLDSILIIGHIERKSSPLISFLLLSILILIGEHCMLQLNYASDTIENGCESRSSSLSESSLFLRTDLSKTTPRVPCSPLLYSYSQ